MIKDTEISSSEEPPGKGLFLPLTQLIPQTKENKYYYTNGLSKLIPRLMLKVHSHIDECFELWEKFSPKKSLFDLWDFRQAWLEGYGHTLYFYTLYERDVALAVLPLWYDAEKKRYEWFGSNWMEDNAFFMNDEKFIDVFYAIAPRPIHLNALEIPSHLNKRKIFSELQKDDPKNIKNIVGIDSIEELLSGMQKKERYNLKHDFLRIKAMNPRVEVVSRKDQKSFDIMKKMNISRFVKLGDDSDLMDKKREAAYRAIINHADSYKVKFIKVYIQKYLAGIDMVITYKDKYYMMKGGSDINRFKGIGNYLLYKEFEDAIRTGSSLIDCLQIDYGWKHRYFDQRDVYVWES